MASWSSNVEEAPLSPFTKCIAIKDFVGEESDDLPFKCGEELTIIEPCSVQFWYIAENSVGRKGTIPITFVQVQSPGRKKERPPPPPPADSSFQLTASSSTPPTSAMNWTTPPPLPPTNSSTPPPLPPMNSSTPPPLPPMNSSTPPPLPPANCSTPPPLPPTNNSTSPNVPQLPPKASPALPLPPKPTSSAKAATTTKTYLTFPRLASNSPLNTAGQGRKKITRVHSNEFRGSQSPHRSQPSNALTVSAGSRRDRSHRHSQPIAPPPSLSSFHATLHHPATSGSPSPPSIHSPVHSEVPPPLPSPRNKAKAVPPPVVPSSSSGKSKTLPSPLTQGAASAPSVQLRELPLVPSDPQLDIDRRPPAPLPNDPSSKQTSDTDAMKTTFQQSTTKYKSQKEFSQRSGWFFPSLESVLCKMMYSAHLSSLTSVTTGVYIFTHKYQTTKRYVGKSRTAYHDLVQMFHRLYEKKEDKLSMLEKELKYNSPDADQWSFRIYSVSNPDAVEAEANKRILLHNTLLPLGLNSSVRFTSRESFDLFAELYARVMREKATMFVNPIRAAQKQND